MNKFKAGQYAQYRDAEEQYTVLVMADSTACEMPGVVVHRLGYTISDDDLAYDVGDVQEKFCPAAFTRVKNPLKVNDDGISSIGSFYQHTGENFTMLATEVKHNLTSVAIGVVVELGVWVPGQPDIGDVVQRPCGSHWERVKNPLKRKNKKANK